MKPSRARGAKGARPPDAAAEDDRERFNFTTTAAFAAEIRWAAARKQADEANFIRWALRELIERIRQQDKLDAAVLEQAARYGRPGAGDVVTLPPEPPAGPVRPA